MSHLKNVTVYTKVFCQGDHTGIKAAGINVWIFRVISISPVNPYYREMTGTIAGNIGESLPCLCNISVDFHVTVKRNARRIKTLDKNVIVSGTIIVPGYYEITIGGDRNLRSMLLVVSIIIIALIWLAIMAAVITVVVVTRRRSGEEDRESREG